MLRRGKYTDAVASVTAIAYDQQYGAEVLADLELGYDVTNKFRIVLGGSNIFDNTPSHEGLIGNRNNGFVYTQNSPFGYNGGFWYARGDLRF